MQMSATIYRTDLAKDECLRRLHEHKGGGGWVPRPEGTIIAKIRGDRFRLFACGPLKVSNSFAPYFYGRLEGGTRSTHIRGAFRFHPITRAYLFVWFGGLVAMCGFLLLLPQSAWGGRPPPRYAVLGPIGMIFLGVGLVRWCRWLARRQLEGLRNFLAHELQAQLDVDGSP
jgi:hypothetical protein